MTGTPLSSVTPATPATPAGRGHEITSCRAALVLLAMAGACATAALVTLVAACSARTERPPPGIDCSEEAPFESLVLDGYEPGSTGFGWYDYGDNTPGAARTVAVGGVFPRVPIEDGGRCGSQNAIYLLSRGYNDYGSGFATYSLGVQAAPDGGPCQLADGSTSVICSLDVSAWDGLRFWARSHPGPLPDGGVDPGAGSATKGFTLSINDGTSFFGVDSTCVPFDASYLSNGAVNLSPSYGAMGAAGGGLTTAYPPAGACGLPFTVAETVTDEWHLYTIPWSAFTQLARPQRSAGGFDPSSLFQILLTTPREAALTLWLDDLGVYRTKKDPEAGP